MIGYLSHGCLVWTFLEVLDPVIAKPHNRCSVTTVEAVSATGKTIPSFIILPGVNIIEKFFAITSKKAQSA